MKIRKAYFLWKIYKNQFKSKAEIQRLQLRRLKRIVAHACATVPYYRNLFQKADISPKDIRRLDDIKKIPVTRKEDLLPFGVGHRLSSTYSQEKLLNFRTGGSTGKIMDILCSKATDDLRGANILRTCFANGYRLTDKIGILQFSPVKQKWFHKLGLMKKLEIPYQMPIDAQLKLLQKVNPEILMGYPSRLSLIAQAVSENRITDIMPRLIFTNSETLTENNKNDIVDAFRVQPVNVYDSWEFADIAWECERHEGLHINSDLFYVEIGNGNENASHREPGEIIITDFFNTAMPFIRYASGDLGVKADNLCGCGRGFPLIKEVIGRTVEKMILSNGTELVPTGPISVILQELTGIREYQAIQYKKGELVIHIVTDERFSSEASYKLEQQLCCSFRLGKVVIKPVKSIKRTPAGKLRTIISHIHSE